MDFIFLKLRMRLTRIGFCFGRVSVAAVVALALASCSSETPPAPPVEAQSAPGPAGDMRVPSAANSETNQARLKELYEKRSKAAESVDYPIGPGDVIQISVPGVDDLKERLVRVGGDGKIELPLIGQVQAGGLTEPQLTEQLKVALGKYMYSPQVDVFIKEYRSRQVAVVGAVRTPGLITLTNSDISILDAITQAGGLTAEAADEIVILPEVKGGKKQLERLAASLSEEHEPQHKLAGADPSQIGTPFPPSYDTDSLLLRWLPSTHQSHDDGGIERGLHNDRACQGTL